MNNIELKYKILNDDYTEYIYNVYDIQNKDESITNIKDDLTWRLSEFTDWNIGLIYGSSGSGKSTLLNTIGEVKNYQWDDDIPLISNFKEVSPEQASKVLMGVGLSSIPVWLRPYKTLSVGEKYRADVAKIISQSNIENNKDTILLIDEFTSVIDRDVAKSMSFALQRFIRKTNKKIILASCHTDIIEWLNPDWMYSPITGQIETRSDCLRQRRPKIKLQIHRVTYDTWNLFKQHHYLTEDLHRSCKLFLFTWNNKPVAIQCTINFPHGTIKNGICSSRVVVLPDYQGLGLGKYVSDIIASMYTALGFRYFTKTIHPTLGLYRNANPDKWRPTTHNVEFRKDIVKGEMSFNHWNALKRSSYSHEYVGNPFKNLVDPDFILKNNNELSKIKIMKMMY